MGALGAFVFLSHALASSLPLLQPYGSCRSSMQQQQALPSHFPTSSAFLYSVWRLWAVLGAVWFHFQARSAYSPGWHFHSYQLRTLLGYPSEFDFDTLSTEHPYI